MKSEKLETFLSLSVTKFETSFLCLLCVKADCYLALSHKAE